MDSDRLDKERIRLAKSYFDLGNNYEDMEDPWSALDCYRNACRLDPENQEYKKYDNDVASYLFSNQ